MYSLISETLKFKDYEFASTGNQLPYVLAAVDRVINWTIASKNPCTICNLHNFDVFCVFVSRATRNTVTVTVSGYISAANL